MFLGLIVISGMTKNVHGESNFIVNVNKFMERLIQSEICNFK